ncbi:MAG: hypothetical protein SNJ70_02145 [Armatimonadota bacterium]
MKRLGLLTVAIFLALSCNVSAGVNMYGLSGIIETPDDSITPTFNINLGGKYIIDYGNTNNYLTSYGGTFGLLPNFEVGIVGFDSDLPGKKTKAVFGGKYRVLDETFTRPSITVGATDIAQQLKSFEPKINEVSTFVLLGKNLTNVAEHVTDSIVKPVHGTIGIGTGLYKGMFAGLNISLSENFDAKFEYLSNGFRRKGTANAGLTYIHDKKITIEGGTFAFEDLYFGAGYTLSTY